jgi:hypothetical protein
MRLSWHSLFYEQSLQSTFDLFVPQTIDQGVEHGIEKAVKQQEIFLLLLRVSISRSNIRDNGCAVRVQPHRDGRSKGRRLFLTFS